MSTPARRLARSSFYYGLGGVLSKLLGIVLLPVYTRYLTPADYGELALLLITGSIVAVLIQGGLGSAVFREVLYEGSDEDRTLGTALRFMLGVGVVLVAALAGLAPQVSRLVLGTAEHSALFRVVFVTSLLQAVEALALARFRMRNQATGYAALASVRFATGAALNIVFVAVLRRGVEGLVVAILLNSTLYAACYLYVLRGAIRTGGSGAILGRLTAFGFPLVPAGLAALALTSIDRYLLRVFTTTEQVGLYSLGYSAGLAVALAVQAVQLAWPAEAFAIARRPDGPHVLARLVKYYLAVVGFGAVAVSAFATEILLVLATPAFYAAATVVPLIAVSHLLNGLRLVTNVGVGVRAKTTYTAVVMALGVATNVLLNVLLIPGWGMLGAAWAAVAAYALMLAASLRVNLRLWPVRYDYSALARVTLALVGVFAVCLRIDAGSVWTGIALKFLVLGMYPVLLFVLRAFDRREWHAALALLLRREPV